VLIIIEGVDGSGKSTLAHAINRTVGGLVIKRDKPVLPPLIEYTADLANYRPGKRLAVVCDRWHLGERVYGPLYRGGCGLSPMAWAAAEGFLADLGAIGVLCTAPADALARRLIARGESPDLMKLRQEVLAFDRALTWSTLPWRTFDTTTVTTDEMMYSAIALARQAEENACV